MNAAFAIDALSALSPEFNHVPLQRRLDDPLDAA
jgi:hypothetical protein